MNKFRALMVFSSMWLCAAQHSHEEQRLSLEVHKSCSAVKHAAFYSTYIAFMEGSDFQAMSKGLADIPETNNYPLMLRKYKANGPDKPEYRVMKKLNLCFVLQHEDKCEDLERLAHEIFCFKKIREDLDSLLSPLMVIDQPDVTLDDFDRAFSQRIKEQKKELNEANCAVFTKALNEGRFLIDLLSVQYPRLANNLENIRRRQTGSYTDRIVRLLVMNDMIKRLYLGVEIFSDFFRVKKKGITPRHQTYLKNLCCKKAEWFKVWDVDTYEVEARRNI